MLHIIPGYDRDLPENRDLIDQMHQLRAKAFHTRRGWRVEVVNGRERDAFDDLDPLYVLVSNADGQLASSLRLLPTTGPYMMADVFPEVQGPMGRIRDPLTFESSRFCADRDVVADFGRNGINLVTRMMLYGGMCELQKGGVQHVVSVYDILVERILKRAGLIFERLGPVVAYDEGLKTTSGLFEISDASIARMKRLIIEDLPAFERQPISHSTMPA